MSIGRSASVSSMPFKDAIRTASLRLQGGAPRGLLSRALLWLEDRRSAQASRRLQLCATVSLGEKRFVSIVECDGQQFLIGGGAGNVSLLAQLPPKQETSEPVAMPIRAERAR